MSLDDSGRFVLDNFQGRRPFSSFLPGVAGALGIPMWVCYVNRGQAITCFGIQGKDSAIMEFQNANKAYQVTSLLGFRTFLKLSRGGQNSTYEPFSTIDRALADDQKMRIGANDLIIEESSQSKGLKTQVRYYTLPDEHFAGLVREVTIENTGVDEVQLEILDGTPCIHPFGVNEWLLKHMSRTVEAWHEVFNLDHQVPFYRVRASVEDKAEVESVQAGHFVVPFIQQGNEIKLLPSLVDPSIVFGSDTTFLRPEEFYSHGLSNLLSRRQITCGRTPCGLFGHTTTLKPQQSVKLHFVYGHTGSQSHLSKITQKVTAEGYLENKHKATVDTVKAISRSMWTQTSNPIFDAYCEQNFVDNVLRGGWPVQLGTAENPHVYPIYSRKHGDMERDYNAFVLAPEPFSQGEGSYRDVNQNRRDNVWFNNWIKDYDIRTFMSLVQLDGYNPRAVRGDTFSIKADHQADVLSHTKPSDKLAPILSGRFTPGKLLRHVWDHEIELDISPDKFLELVLSKAEQHIEASFFEGYWIDHWEYTLDLVDSYLALYPEDKSNLLFGARKYPFFDSPAYVQPRTKRYVLLGGDKPRQLGSLLEDKEKESLIHKRGNWMTTQDGSVYFTTLFAKASLLVLIKFTTLDAWGMGIEMEAGRPGWDDALNGLPALFGSGMSETYELQRWLGFVHDSIADAPHGLTHFALPAEAAELLSSVRTHLKAYETSSKDKQSDFNYWDNVNVARELYREKTRLGLSGAETEIALADWLSDLKSFRSKVQAGIDRAMSLNDGLPPTYFKFEVEYKLAEGKDPQGRPYIQVNGFQAHVLPPFLEGPVRSYKVAGDLSTAKAIYKKVRSSSLYDEKLKMYKVNGPLNDQPLDIGRLRAFPPGWLENESVWLHMEYKYLLEVLRSGLSDEALEDIQNCAVPFLDPNVYGRSPLENSSFLASSAHPDPSLHGAGFVARLSGSTAEFISIWLILMAGKTPFLVKDGKLVLELRPTLAEWMFTKDGTVKFNFLNKCEVTYHYPAGSGPVHRREPQRSEVTLHDGSKVQLSGGTIVEPYAELVRSGKVPRLDVFL